MSQHLTKALLISFIAMGSAHGMQQPVQQKSSSSSCLCKLTCSCRARVGMYTLYVLGLVAYDYYFVQPSQPSPTLYTHAIRHHEITNSTHCYANYDLYTYCGTNFGHVINLVGGILCNALPNATKYIEHSAQEVSATYRYLYR